MKPSFLVLEPAKKLTLAPKPSPTSIPFRISLMQQFSPTLKPPKAPLLVLEPPKVSLQVEEPLKSLSSTPAPKASSPSSKPFKPSSAAFME